MKAYVGWDPGHTGAIALMVVGGRVGVYDWHDEIKMHKALTTWAKLYDIQMVAIEKVHGMKGNSSRSDTTFQQHTGACKCIIKLAGLPMVEVLPQVWMKRRLPAKKHPKDKPSVPYVQARYPHINLFGPRGGVKDGRSDAICIAEWCKENYHG